MPRPKRLDIPGIPQHVVQRGNNRQKVFYAPEHRKAYLKWLAEGAKRYGLAIHAYCLMTNHVHLLVTPERKGSIGRTFQHLGRHYVGYINCRQGRTGTLWEGRYKASVIDSESYLLSCYRYIELNPVRAEMVAHPRDYPWSSYRANAEGEGEHVIVPHPLYLGLGATDASRMRAYRDLFRDALDPDVEATIRDAISHNHHLGGEDFRVKLEQLAGRPVSASSRGRPAKQKELTNAAET
ncbi:MAG: transposase, partial [Gammaproteobacteria bacterium]|nr:transposase [Gammaproteobacteria bacterium]